MMKSYTAYCMNEDGENLCMTREYTSKAHFISDLHGNGYKVHFVALTDKYDEESDKYHERLEKKRRIAAINRKCDREYKELQKRVHDEVMAELAADQAEEATEEATQEVQTMKERYFYMSDIDSTMCVEISTKKEMIDLLDETIRFNCTDEECIFDILYKDGTEIRIDENNRQYKKTGIISIVNDNGTTVQVYGHFEINENGVVYPAAEEKIDENIIEVADWNYHAPTEEEIDELIVDEIEIEFEEQKNAELPKLYRNLTDNAPEVREMLNNCSHIMYDWRRNHALFFKHEGLIGECINADNMDLQKVAASLGKSYSRTW